MHTSTLTWEHQKDNLPKKTCQVEFYTWVGDRKKHWVGKFNPKKNLFQTFRLGFDYDKHGNAIGKTPKKTLINFLPKDVLQWAIIGVKK